MTKMSNLQLVTLALAQLGGHSRAIDQEDVAIRVYGLSPSKFCWRKHPEWIDLEAVVVALRDARKKKNGALVIGNSIDGWILSPNGIAWVQSLSEDVTGTESNENFRRNSLTAELIAEQHRLCSTRAYLLFTTDKKEQITKQDFFEFARINEYFQLKARQKRFNFIENAVAGQQALEAVWTYLQQMFNEEHT